MHPLGCWTAGRQAAKWRRVADAGEPSRDDRPAFQGLQVCLFLYPLLTAPASPCMPPRARRRAIAVLTWSNRQHRFTPVERAVNLYCSRHGYDRLISHRPRLPPDTAKQWEKAPLSATCAG